MDNISLSEGALLKSMLDGISKVVNASQHQYLPKTYDMPSSYEYKNMTRYNVGNTASYKGKSYVIHIISCAKMILTRNGEYIGWIEDKDVESG